MQVILMRIEANSSGVPASQTDQQIKLVRVRTNYFLAAFIAFEVAILTLKYVIYAVNKDWAKIEVW